MTQDDDPVVASYDIILSNPSVQNNPSTESNSVPSIESKSAPSDHIFVLQYPAHRASHRPYTSSTEQKPLGLRHKARTGIVEIDVPILTSEHYNHQAGSRYGTAVAESRIARVGGTYGLSGGFNSGPAQPTSLHDVPTHNGDDRGPAPLTAQTLGGKIAKSTEKDPLYFLGALREGALHLTPLDAVVQLRPQLHHIDAEEELAQRRMQVGGPNAGKSKVGADGAPKLESKAIELKLKDNKEDPRDRSLNANTRLLRDIQIDPWQKHHWVEQSEEASRVAIEAEVYGDPHITNTSLKSALSNSDWLDRMSAPREDGKKGLLAKLRGRERERARRKKAEEERKRHSKATAATDTTRGPLLEQSSDSELSSPDASDLENDADLDVNMQGTVDRAIEIKEEPNLVEPTGSVAAPAAPKKRGRPKKNVS
jgi:hypothetical protein